MRTHRPHKKSRNGCTTCKRRKIKCDERRPVCSPCAYRQTTTTCSYNDFISFVPGPQPVSASENSEVNQNFKDDHAVMRTPPSGIALLELFSRLPRSPLPNYGTGIADSTLLAHYCQRTSITLAGAGDGKSESRSVIWRQAIPYVAYQHQCVSHAIAALAALHVWCERICQPQEAIMANQQIKCALDTAACSDSDLLTRRYLHQATIHHGHCLKWFQEELRSVGEHNVDAVLACSALLAPFRLAYSQVERRLAQSRPLGTQYPREDFRGLTQKDEQNHSLDKRESIVLDLTWINLMRGIHPSVQVTQLQRVRGSTILPLLQWSEDERRIMLQAMTSGRTTSFPSGSPSLEERPLLSTILAEGEPALTVLRRQLEIIRMQQQFCFHGQQPCPSRNLEVCLHAVQSLQIVAKQFALVKARNRRFLMAWVLPLDDVYVRLLAEKDDIAMAVYAHFLVYGILLDDLWWVGDLGVATIRSILEGLEIIPRGERYSGERHQSGCVVKDEIRVVNGSLDLQALFVWPARILELYELNSLSPGNRLVQPERSLPKR